MAWHYFTQEKDHLFLNGFIFETTLRGKEIHKKTFLQIKPRDCWSVKAICSTGGQKPTWALQPGPVSSFSQQVHSGNGQRLPHRPRLATLHSGACGGTPFMREPASLLTDWMVVNVFPYILFSYYLENRNGHGHVPCHSLGATVFFVAETKQMQYESTDLTVSS